MKKLLLLSLAAMAGFTAGAAVPTVIEEVYANGISPNGLWGVSYIYGLTDIVNLTTGQVINVNEGDGTVDTGSNNNISNDGVMVGSLTDIAAWYVNGEFQFLNDNMPNYGISGANSITPDGKRIVGYCSNPDIDPNTDDNTLYLPVYWDVNADGTVSDPVKLPYPTLDIVGQIPQLIIANSVSDDGRTIAGHLVDCAGSLVYPVLFTQADDNTWSYSLPTEKYLNPSHITLPEQLPAPEFVNVYDYMTPEEIAAYEAQEQIYWTTWDDADEPKFEDYMTPEEWAAYSADFAAYQEANEAYINALIAYQDAYWQIIDESVNILRNSVYLSSDAKTLVCGCELPGGSFFNPAGNYVAVVDLATSDLTKSPEEYSIVPTGIAADGTIIADTPSKFMGAPTRSYILNADASTCVPVEEYMATTNPDIAEWITENLVREFIEYDPDTWEENIIDYPYTGLYFFSSDMKTFFAGVQPTWEGYDAEHSEFFCYTSSGLTTALKGATIAKDNVTITGQLGGTILIAGNASTVEVYDLAGRKVFAADAAPALTTGLPSGLYIVKTEGPAGTTTAKVTL